MAINFPDSPTPGQIFQSYVWDGEKWLGASSAAAGSVVGAVRYDAAQALTSTERSQARANIAVTKKNYVVNGGMQVSQENGATAGTAAGYFPVDAFSLQPSNAGVVTAAQIASATPGGALNRIRLTVSTADASVAAGDFLDIQQGIEGLRIADLRFGSLNAKAITLQFGVKAPAGTYCVALSNAAGNRSYVAEYIITAGEANTDVIRSITIQSDTTGTWAVDNTLGIYVRWTLMVGTTYQTSAGAWVGINAIGSPNQSNFMGTNGNVFELFDVSLTEGSVAPPFQLPDYASELALCQRYWQSNTAALDYVATAAGHVNAAAVNYASRMRSLPTVALGTVHLTANCAAPTIMGAPYSSANAVAIQTISSAGTVRVTWYGLINSNARL